MPQGGRRACLSVVASNLRQGTYATTLAYFPIGLVLAARDRLCRESDRVGLSGGPETNGYSWFETLSVEAQFPCGPEDVDQGVPGQPFALKFGFGGSSVTVAHGHRDVLPFDKAQVFAIDLSQATTNYCCHYTRKFDLLLRRVQPL